MTHRADALENPMTAALSAVPDAARSSAPAAVRMGRRETLRFFRRVAGVDPLPALAGIRGGNALAEVRAPGSSVYIVRHPAHARHVLVTHQDAYVKGVDYRILGIVLGNGLLTNRDQESWQRNRSLVQPLFARRHLGPMTGHMVGAASDWLDALDHTVRDGEVIDANTAMMALTLDVVGRALFGKGITGETTSVVGDAITDLLKAAGAFYDIAPFARAIDARTTVEFQDVMRVRWRHYARVEARKEQLDAIVHGLIDARLSSGPLPDGDDLLSLLLSARDERGDDGMDRMQVRDEVMTFLGAGHETTANALSWTWMLLSQYPEARRRMEAEVDEVLGGREPTFDDVDRLPWTNAVLQESLRLYPVAPVMSRVAARDDDLDGAPIRKGGVMIIAPYLLHRDPEFWVNPEGFDPERFLPGAGHGSRPRQSYMPFGAGRRICVGQGFALVESVLLTAMTAQRYRFDLAPGFQLRREVAVTMRPRDGLPMAVRRRTDAPALV
jgi:cytochrome P450